MAEPSARRDVDRHSGQTLSVEIRQTSPVPIDVAFECEPTQVLAIFGPSGAGKTTVLRSIAGLHRPPHARIRSGGETWTDTRAARDAPARARRVGMVFQEYALFPHMDARGNVAAALGDLPADARAREADRWLAAVRLIGLERRRPAELSGGERQRVALARALARRPRVLLLDEPFAAVDRSTRRQLHDELDALRRDAGIPVVLVTHDWHDVVRLATHVALLDRGVIVARGSLEEMSSRADVTWPRVADDAGSVIDTRVDAVDRARGLAALRVGGQTVLVPLASLAEGAGVRLRVPAREVILATRRPEGLSLHNILSGTVSALARTADEHVLAQIAVGDARLLAEITPDAVHRLSLAEGAAVFALVKSVSIEVYGKTAG